MRNLLLTLFALLLSVPSAAAVDAGYLDVALTPYHFNVTTGSGTREHVGTIDPHVTDKTGGSVDSYLCLQSYSNSVAQDFLCGSAGNVTMPGTLAVTTSGTFSHVEAATLTLTGITNTTDHAFCRKAGGVVGVCSDAVGAGGTCTCN